MRKLSIITINYNNLDGLRRTIDSVICQTWKDYEWIVIDGGSTDGSKELIEQYQEHFAYWCSEPDRGIYHAMNKGIAKAIGDYLIFMNSGDAFYNENVLDKVFSVERTADIITGQVVRSDNNQLLRRYDDNLLIQLYKDTLNHQGSFIKRDLFRNRRYDEDFKIVSDWKFWFETIMCGDASVEVVNEVIAVQDMMGISSVNLSNDGIDSQLEERRRVLDLFFPPLLQQTLDEYLQQQNSPYIIYGKQLEQKSHFLHAVSWRLLRLLSNFA